MRTPALIVALAVVFGAGGFVASRWLFPDRTPAAASVVDPVEIGERYRDLVLTDLAGRPRRLSEWDGRPRLLNFWATWCAPCVREMPLLDAYARAHPEVAVIGIALDDPHAAARFVERLAIGYPILVERVSASDASVVYGNRRGVLPYSAWIDASGTLRAAGAGDFEDAAAIDRFMGRSNDR